MIKNNEKMTVKDEKRTEKDKKRIRIKI